MSQEVRLATLEDLNDLVVLGEASFRSGGLNDYYEYDIDTAIQEFTSMVESTAKILIVLVTSEGVKGMFGAVAINALFGKGIVTYEQYIYIDEKYRGGYVMKRFMTAYAHWGKELGAVMQGVCSIKEHEKLERFYGLFGYTPVDRVYARSI
ncbi:MAG: hypothetical protein QQN63_00125 [Nitrosopumilus sp.]